MTDSDFCDAVRWFLKLGTGHRKQKVLIADRRHLTDFATVHGVSRVLHNWHFSTPKRIMLEGVGWCDVHRDTDGEYILWRDGQPAFLFFWSDYGEGLYGRQKMREKITDFLKDADADTVFATWVVIATEAGESPSFSVAPYFVAARRSQIDTRLRKLSLTQLTRIWNDLCSLTPNAA